LAIAGLAMGCSGGTFYQTGTSTDGGASTDGGVVADGGASSAEPAETGTVTSYPAPPENGANIYYAACVTELSVNRVDRVLSFYAVVTFANGVLSMALTPLKLDPGNHPPATVSKASTVGTTVNFTAVPVNNGTFGVSLDAMTIPGAANPISGRDIEMKNVTLPGKLGAARFCSRLAAHVVSPVDISLQEQANTCLYVPVAGDGAATPTLHLSDFSRPCALE
jgi:hypothetical protein